MSTTAEHRKVKLLRNGYCYVVHVLEGNEWIEAFSSMALKKALYAMNTIRSGGKVENWNNKYNEQANHRN